MQWRFGSIGRHPLLCPWITPCCSSTSPALLGRCYSNTHIGGNDDDNDANNISGNDDTNNTHSRAYSRFVLTLLLVLYAYIPLQNFRLAYIVIHFAIHIICSSSLALGDNIIHIHCSDENFLPKGIIYRSLNSYLRTVFFGGHTFIRCLLSCIAIQASQIF